MAGISNLIREKFYPYVFSTLAVVCWYGTKFSLDPEFEKEIFTATLGVSGIFCGFLATCKAILMTSNNSVLADIAKTGYKKELVGYLRAALLWNLVFCAVCVSALFFSSSPNWLQLIWVFLLVTSGLTFWRVASIMITMMEYD